MCGFGVTNTLGISNSNKFCQKRGPDITTFKKINGIEFLHNLLQITGETVTQPIVKDDIVCVFNGEIYNFKSFGDYKSDGLCLIDVYKNVGDDFASHLDGEFAICLVDFKSQKIIIAVDTFSCKPL